MHGERPGGHGRARAERTLNMKAMFVTPEVSQLEMSALISFKPEKRWLMSVMPETSQSAIGPYVAVAVVGFASNAWTAVCREALVVKVPGGGDGGSGGGSGGGDGGDGGDGSDGGWNCTTKGDGGGGLGKGGGGVGGGSVGGGGVGGGSVGGGGGEGEGGAGLGEGEGEGGGSEGCGGGGEGNGGGGLGDGGGGEGDGGGGGGEGGVHAPQVMAQESWN